MQTVTPPVTPMLKPAYLALFLTALGGAIALAATEGWAGLWFIALPDVALLGGMGTRGLAKGQLAPAAVPFYNALHSLPGPVLLGASALVALGPSWTVAALAWIAHIAMDRAVGYGLRTKDGFQRA